MSSSLVTVPSLLTAIQIYELTLCEDFLGAVQTSCFCRAKLNSGIKFDKQLSSTSSAVLHDCGTAAI